VNRRLRGQVHRDPDGAITPEVAPFVGDPIVTPEEWARAQRLLDDSASAREDYRSLPLGGLLICDQCGRIMYSTHAKYKETTYWYYFCKGRPPELTMGPRDHPGVTVRADDAWSAIVGRMADDLFTPDAMASIIAAAEASLRGAAAGRDAAVASLASRSAAVQQSIETVRRNMLYAPSPELSVEFAAELSRLKAEHRQLSLDMLAARSLGAAAARGAKERAKAIQTSLARLRDDIGGTDAETARRAIRSLVASVRVRVDGRGRNRAWSANIEYRPAAELCNRGEIGCSPHVVPRILIPLLAVTNRETVTRNSGPTRRAVTSTSRPKTSQKRPVATENRDAASRASTASRDCSANQATRCPPDQ
jgi:hypothetical protein